MNYDIEEVGALRDIIARQQEVLERLQGLLNRIKAEVNDTSKSDRDIWKAIDTILCEYQM